MNKFQLSPSVTGLWRAVQHMHSTAGFGDGKHGSGKSSFAVNISSRISLVVTSCELLLGYYLIRE